jgi:hypothetical protein
LIYRNLKGSAHVPGGKPGENHHEQYRRKKDKSYFEPDIETQKIANNFIHQRPPNDALLLDQKTDKPNQE